MRCSKAKIKLSVYLDSELNEYEKNELLLHLENCKNCRAENVELSLIMKKIRLSEQKKIEVPPYFNLKIKQKIRGYEEKQYFWQRLFFPKFNPSFAGLNFVLIFFLSVITGFYFTNHFDIAKTNNILSETEFRNELTFDYFNDIPAESLDGIYNNLLTGRKNEK